MSYGFSPRRLSSLYYLHPNVPKAIAVGLVTALRSLFIVTGDQSTLRCHTLSVVGIDPVSEVETFPTTKRREEKIDLIEDGSFIH